MIRRIVAVAAIVAAPLALAAPAAAYMSCQERYIVSGNLERAESVCWGVLRGQQAEIRWLDAAGYHWSFGACVGNGVTSYTLFRPNVVEGGVRSC